MESFGLLKLLVGSGTTISNRISTDPIMMCCTGFTLLFIQGVCGGVPDALHPIFGLSFNHQYFESLEVSAHIS